MEDDDGEHRALVELLWLEKTLSSPFFLLYVTVELKSIHCSSGVDSLVSFFYICNSSARRIKRDDDGEGPDTRSARWNEMRLSVLRHPTIPKILQL